MPWAKETIDKLSALADITVVSAGSTANLGLKEEWLTHNLPYVSFIGVNFDNGESKDNVDMSGGVFIDDLAENLNISNADMKICFGDEYPWNKEWNGIRMANWCDVWRMFKPKEDTENEV